MQRMGAVITAFRRGILLKPVIFAPPVYRTLDKKNLQTRALLSRFLRDFTNAKCVLSARAGCIFAAGYLVRENLIVDDRADNRSVLIAGSPISDF
jgi:hypothetical protein